MTDGKYVYTVNIVGAFGESVWGAFTDMDDAVKSAKAERYIGDYPLDAYVERVPLNGSGPSTTVWESWGSDAR